MSDHWIRATYRLQASSDRALQRALALALEQSIEMPVEAVADRHVAEHFVARVADVEPLADGRSLAQLQLSVASVGDDAGQLMNMLFGNSSLQPDVELLDVDVPRSLAKALGGPNLGVAGLRALTGASGRPLTCTALKPIGSSAEQLGQLCRTFAAAGIDLIKDDHGWADQRCCPFDRRVAACQRAVDEVSAARGGSRTIYAPSLFGTSTQMQQQIAHARAHGVRALLIAPMVCGVSTLAELKREHSDLAFIAHPALAGAGRIAAPALLGRLFRLFGADAVIFPNHGGRFSYSPADCATIVRNALSPWHGLRASMPVPAGGMAVERVPELKRDYGNDCMLLIGGSLLIARERLAERSRAFVQAVAAGAQAAA